MTSRDYLIYFLAFTGGMTLIAGLGCILYNLCQYIKEELQKAKRKIEIKHRFEKSPIAKCYCIDCAHCDTDCYMCYQFDQYVKDNGFCYKAEPRR